LSTVSPSVVEGAIWHSRIGSGRIFLSFNGG
jgi:hypothetical protein